MSLLDQPTDTVRVYPQSLAVDDAYGTPTLGAQDSFVDVPCRVQPVSSADLAGQAVGTVYRIDARTFPAGSFPKITWNGRTWEVLGEPLRYHGSARTAHVAVYIQAQSPEVSTEV